MEHSPVSPISDRLRENLTKTSHKDVVKLERGGADPGRALQAGLTRHPAAHPRVDPPAHDTNIRFYIDTEISDWWLHKEFDKTDLVKKSNLIISMSSSVASREMLEASWLEWRPTASCWSPTDTCLAWLPAYNCLMRIKICVITMLTIADVKIYAVLRHNKGLL